PASVLNHCRRDLTTKLMQKHWLSSGQRTVNRQALTQANLESAAARPKPVNPRLAVLTDDESTALAAARHGIMDIYVDVEGFRGKKKIDCANLNQKLKPYRARLIPYLPQIIAEKDVTDWQNRISSWQESGLSAVVINNLGQLKLAEGVGWQGALYAGTGMNVFNGSSGRFLAELGVSRIALSQELSLEQLQVLGEIKAEKELMVQGASQLMVSEYCAIGALLGGRSPQRQCTAPCIGNNQLSLRDDKGYAFPVRCDNDCRMHVFNSRELCLLPDISVLGQAGIAVLLLDLRLYPLPKANRLIELYRLAISDKWGLDEAAQKIGKVMEGEFTKGHLYRGV
ncbi:MAG: U32 family peptidase, partial [Clostridiales bacterium]